MAREHIFIDQSELTLRFMRGNQPASLNLSRDNIQRFVFEHYDERILFFFKKPSERITIVSSKGTVSYTKKIAGPNFDRYKEMLEEYSKKYHIGIVRK